MSADKFEYILSQEKDELFDLLLAESESASSSSDVILPRQLDGDIPLSFAQQRLWFFDQKEKGSSAYNVPYVLRIQGLLHVDVLQRCLQKIVQRHEILRTTFHLLGGQVVQRLAATVDIPLPEITLSSFAGSERYQRALQMASEEVLRPFDLETGPLLRGIVLHLQAEDCLLVLTWHHIIFDGWSKEVFIRELGLLYTQLLLDAPAQLPLLPIQYADFVLWQRQYLDNSLVEKQLKYWEHRLQGAPSILDLPTDYSRPIRQTYDGASLSFPLPAPLTDALRALSQHEGATLFMTLLAAFNILLYRMSGQHDILIGSPIAGRNRSELEGLIGFFVNMLVLRSEMSDNMSFSELLQQVRSSTLEAYAQQDLPFDQLVAHLQPVRTVECSPLFQVVFVLQNTPEAQLRFGELCIQTVKVPFPVAKFDLTLEVTEAEHQLMCKFEYSTALFAETTIARLREHWLMLLEGIAAHSQWRIADFPLLTAGERHKLLIEWNATTLREDQTEATSLPDAFMRQAVQTPHALVVTYEDRSLTYQELDQKTNQLARYLYAHGVRPDTLVGLCVERSLEMLIGVLGILKAGGAYVPLDPVYPQVRLRFMLDDAHVALLLTQRHLAERLPVEEQHVLCLDTDWPQIAAEADTPFVSQVSARNLAYVIYTSGSTGRPKGVLIEHRGLVNLARGQIQTFRVNRDSRILQFASLSFDASISEIAMALLSGARLYIGRREHLLPGPALLTFLRQQCITHITLPPSVLNMLDSNNLPDLRVVISAGEPLALDTAQRWLSEHELLNAYGPCEVTVCATIETRMSGARPTIGRPIAQTQVYILDARLEPVPVGTTGELYITGIGLARGYLNQAALTAERFLPHPFASKAGERLYKTGDLARYWADGTIEFMGRSDHQVKIRGFRIELDEIENALRLHSAIAHAVVLVREYSPYDKRLIAFLVMKEGQCMPSHQQLRQHLQEIVPEYMLPAYFQVIEAIPINTNGKVDRDALLRASLHKVAHQSATAEDVLPQTERELVLASVWQEVLNVERVGLHDNFFDLGGNSLLAVLVLTKLQERFSCTIDLIDIFQYTTISMLTQEIGRKLVSSPSERSSGQAEPSLAAARSGVQPEKRNERLKHQRQIRRENRTAK